MIESIYHCHAAPVVRREICFGDLLHYTYARSTPEALEDAVNRLTEPGGAVIQFKRKVG